jgi:hypothetical protein
MFWELFIAKIVSLSTRQIKQSLFTQNLKLLLKIEFISNPLDKNCLTLSKLFLSISYIQFSSNCLLVILILAVKDNK